MLLMKLSLKLLFYGGDTVKYNDCSCKMPKENLTPMTENIVTYSNFSSERPGCNTPVRRHLQPTLIARIYNQPIIEELPYSAMSMTLDNTTTISSVQNDMVPMCSDGRGDDYNFSS